MRAVISKIVAGSMIAGAALLASACTSNESTNVTNTTEVVPTENVTTDTMVTNIDAAATENGAVVENTTTVETNTTNAHWSRARQGVWRKGRPGDRAALFVSRFAMKCRYGTARMVKRGFNPDSEHRNPCPRGQLVVFEGSMLASRIALMLAGGIGLFASAPASAQFFLKPANLESGRVTGAEPGMTGPALPGATAAELRAALAWNLRAALNVAALQCQFEPTLLSVDNYNSLIKDHAIELRDSYATLEKYFERAYKNKKQGQLELDKYGTRIYSGFSTVQGQLSFCQTAAAIGHDAVFVKPGQFGDLAQDRMKELRASLGPWGEQYRPSGYIVTGMYGVKMPPFGNDKCWKKGQYQVKKCGPLLID